jgi:hypothetical protein
MTIARTSFDIPPDLQIIDPQTGRLTNGGQELLSKFGAALSKLRDAADAMDTLAASPTTTEIATAWNEVRTTLQEIV